MRVPSTYEDDFMRRCGTQAPAHCDSVPGETMSQSEYDHVTEMIRLGWMTTVQCDKGCSHAVMTPAGEEARRLKRLAELV